MTPFPTAYGVEEGASLWLNNTLDLQNLPLARDVVKRNIKVLEDVLAGETAKLAARLPSGAIVRKGDKTADIFWDQGTGQVASIISYTITHIWQFPDGRVKVRMTMDDDPSKSSEVDNVRWMIQEWWPAVGNTYMEFQQAAIQAGAVNHN
jgi:hypothetical protein